MRREDLRAIEGMTEEQVEAVMRLHGQDEAAHNATVQGLQAQLTSVQQSLAAFDGVDVNDLRSQITSLTTQMQTQAAEYAFNDVLRSAAREAGALDEADVIALLPEKTVLQAHKPYLFAVSPAPEGGQPQQGAAETNPIVIPKPRAQGGSTQPTLAEFLNMTGAERMALRTRNPALFQQLSAQLRAARY